MRVEYLLLFADEEEICKSITTLNNLIQSYDGISISKNVVSYMQTSFAYEVQSGHSESSTHRYFHIALSDKGDIQEFKDFLRLLRTIFTKICGRTPEVLYDEIGSDLCIKAYPLIHNIENQMRKLITKFMLTKVGLGWTKEAIPKEVIESIKAKNIVQNNYLYEVDFIQLSKFLFNEYSSLDAKKVIEKIKSADSINDINLKELKEFVPRSNWDRYFAEIVECSNEYLDKRWQRLYDIRNKVAHNRYLEDQEFIELEKLSIEVLTVIQSAIDNLEKVTISEDQKEEVAENIAANRDEIYMEFIETWNLLLNYMSRVLIKIYKGDTSTKYGKGHNWRSMVNDLKENKIVNMDFKNQLTELSYFRNSLVHHNDVIFTKESVIDRIQNCFNLIQLLQDKLEIKDIDLT